MSLMDDHVIVVVLEYHVTANDTGEAIIRVMDNVHHNDQSLKPHDVMVIKAQPR